MHVRYDCQVRDDAIVLETNLSDYPLTVRIQKADGAYLLIDVPADEIDRIIDALRMAKDAIRMNASRDR